MEKKKEQIEQPFKKKEFHFLVSLMLVLMCGKAIKNLGNFLNMFLEEEGVLFAIATYVIILVVFLAVSIIAVLLHKKWGIIAFFGIKIWDLIVSSIMIFSITPSSYKEMIFSRMALFFSALGTLVLFGLLYLKKDGYSGWEVLGFKKNPNILNLFRRKGRYEIRDANRK